RRGDEVPPGALIPEIRSRVDRLALHENLVVQVRTGGAPAIAGAAELRAAIHPLAHGDADLGEVSVHAFDVVAVVDHHGMAVLAVPSGEAHAAGGGGAHGRAAFSANVDPRVELLLRRPRRRTIAELGVHRAADGPA